MKKKTARIAPSLTVRIFRPSGFLSGPPLVRCDVLTAPAPFRVARRYFAGQRAGLQVVRALPDGDLAACIARVALRQYVALAKAQALRRDLADDESEALRLAANVE